MISKKCDLDHFTKCGQFSNISPHLKKTDVSRGKLKINPKANSTPQACFFIRKFRTPKINLAIDLFSMVERNRHALSVAANPLGAVFHPVTFYRQTVESLAVVSQKLSKGLSKMLYKFLLLGEKRLTIAIRAKSEAEARQQLNLSKNQALFIGQINTRGALCLI